MLIISLTGAIGVGKSAVLCQLKDLTSQVSDVAWVFYTEPVEEWQREGWLEDFNVEPERNAFGFQMKVLLGQAEAMRRWLALEKELRKPLVVVTERSPVDGAEIFIQLSPAVDREKKMVQAYAAQLWRPNVNILITCSPETAEQRRKIRSRDEPSDAYALRLHQKYSERGDLFDCVIPNEKSPFETATVVFNEIRTIL